MGARGVHFAITREQTERITAMKGAKRRVQIVTDEIEETMDTEEGKQWACETDKAWDAIHRCLTDGTLSFCPHPSGLHAIILGDELLCTAEWCLISLVRRERVRELCDPLMAVTRDAMRAGYERIPAEEYPEKDDEYFEYTWGWFCHLREFWKRAAEACRDVIFTVDQ